MRCERVRKSRVRSGMVARVLATVTDVMAPRTLPSLLRASLGWLEQAYAVQGAGRGEFPSLDGWANLLRVLDTGGVERRELPTLARLSKRALRGRVSAAIRRGWVEEATSGRDQGVIRLTGKGADVVARWAPQEGAAEDGWRDQSDPDRATALRTALEAIVAGLPLEHPHHPASYGTVDATITGGPGQDWKPVLRHGTATAAGLPMCALLSQALVAFALCYEELSPVALSISTGILGRVPPESRPLQDIGTPMHLSAMDRHGFVRLDGEGDNDTVFLTAKGRSVSDAYAARVEAVEQTWRQRSVAETVSNLRTVLESIASSSRMQSASSAQSLA